MNIYEWYKHGSLIIPMKERQTFIKYFKTLFVQTIRPIIADIIYELYILINESEWLIN